MLIFIISLLTMPPLPFEGVLVDSKRACPEPFGEDPFLVPSPHRTPRMHAAHIDAARAERVVPEQRAASLWLHSQAAAERFWKERGAAAGFGDGVEVRKKRRMPLAAIPQCTTVARIECVGVERILVAVGVIKELARLAMRSRDGGSVGDSVFDSSDHGLGALHARGPQTVRVSTWQPAAARSARDAGRLAAEAAGFEPAFGDADELLALRLREETLEETHARLPAQPLRSQDPAEAVVDGHSLHAPLKQFQVRLHFDASNFVLATGARALEKPTSSTAPEICA